MTPDYSQTALLAAGVAQWESRRLPVWRLRLKCRLLCHVSEGGWVLCAVHSFTCVRCGALIRPSIALLSSGS
jgi:hypothetical protein